MSSPIPTSTPSPCAAKLYDIPVQQPSCAMPYSSNHTGIMSACCGSTSVVSYYNDCGVFCLAQGQSVRDLMDCLFDHGAGYSQVFCRGQLNAEATAGPVTVAPSASAGIVGAHAASARATQTGESFSSGPSSSSSSSSARLGMNFEGTSRKVGLVLGVLVLLLLPSW